MGFDTDGSKFKAEKINLKVLFTDYKGNQKRDDPKTPEGKSKDGNEDIDKSVMSEARMN